MRKKKFNKHSLIKKNYKKHNILFEYSKTINKTNIKQIVILDKQIYVVSRTYNFNFFFPLSDKRSIALEILNFRDYESKELQFILKIIKRSSIFFDIGANIGYYSLALAKKTQNVYSFEPNKEPYNFLKKNIKFNSLRNIKAFNLGLYHKKKSQLFEYDKNFAGSSSIKTLKKSNKTYVINKVITLDYFINKKKIKKVDFIKCDTEGSELFVLLGAEKTIKKFKPIIQCEMLRKWSKKFKYSPNQKIKFMKIMNYECFRVLISKEKIGNIKVKKSKYKPTFFKKFKLKKVNKIYDTTIETNFLFIHKIKNQKIINKFL